MPPNTKHPLTVASTAEKQMTEIMISYCRKRLVSKHADTRPRRQSSSSNPATFCHSPSPNASRYTNRCGLPATRFQLVAADIFAGFKGSGHSVISGFLHRLCMNLFILLCRLCFLFRLFRHLLEILLWIGRSSHPFQNPPLSGMRIIPFISPSGIFPCPTAIVCVSRRQSILPASVRQFPDPAPFKQSLSSSQIHRQYTPYLPRSGLGISDDLHQALLVPWLLLL